MSVLGATLLAGCGIADSHPQVADDDPRQVATQRGHETEWVEVLRHKKAASAPNATPAQKQVYADSVRAFVQKHPHHGRGREVWQRIQLEFAEELAQHGRYRDALRIYRTVLEHDPMNAKAQEGAELAADRLAVTREKLMALEKGMSPRQVAQLLGKPLPGWTEKRDRSVAEIEAWYYPTRSGGVAGVYFRDGKVFAAEESSHAREMRLGS
ncbi:MAG TPA: hypothetical protein VF111_06485 [Thermoanaerobaculia bacterium]